MKTERNSEMRAVLFDVDGTLADTERDGHRLAFNAAFVMGLSSGTGRISGCLLLMGKCRINAPPIILARSISPPGTPSSVTELSLALSDPAMARQLTQKSLDWST